MDIDSMGSRSQEIRHDITSFAKLVEQRVTGDGWNAYLVTFMFYPVPGGKKAKLQSMTAAIYRFYATFLTRVVRKPKSPFHAGELPLLFAAPDYPVPKSKKQSLSDFAVNDGLHFHGILVVPWKCRLKEDFITHLSSHSATYLKSPLRRIEPILIEKKYRFVTDYAFKSVKRNRFSRDDVIVLPKSRAEIGRGSELLEEMVRWKELGLLPRVIPRSVASDPEETDTKRLLDFAKAFRKMAGDLGRPPLK